MDGWMEGRMDGWMEGKAGLRIAYSNQKMIKKQMKYNHKGHLVREIFSLNLKMHGKINNFISNIVRYNRLFCKN